jgi:hypothetical protein
MIKSSKVYKKVATVIDEYSELVDIEKLTGYPMSMILKVEEDYYESLNELHNGVTTND